MRGQASINPRLLRVAGTFAVAITAAAFHFRPWTRGLLEDLQFASLWAQGGLPALLDVATSATVAGRPLHLVATILGLAISDGGYSGMWLILGLIAGTQVAAVVWALRRLVPPFSLRLALAAVIAFHPWWPAGDILRFMPAQVGVLIFICWFGVVTRFVRQPRVVRGVLVFLLPAMGMLTYQALAALYPLVLLALAMLLRDAWVGVVRAGLLSGIGLTGALTYSVLIVPALFPDSYESSLIGAGGDLTGAIPAIITTLISEAGATLLFALCIAIAVVLAVWSKSIRPRDALLVLGLVSISPLTALVYSATTLHLNDPERVSQPVGAALWLALVIFASRVSWSRFPTLAFSAVTVLVSVLAAVPALVSWQRLADLQWELVAVVQPVSSQLNDGERILLVDYSGVYGDVYTFLPPHLDFALHVETGRFVSTEICTPAGTQRVHPFAARFPIGSTPDCSSLDVTPVSTTQAELSSGLVQIIVFEGTAAPPG